MNIQERTNQKIVREAVILERIVHQWKFFNHKVVFTNGCFDIVHPGHIDILSKAANLGDKLIVAINSDASIQGLKGNDRPFFSEELRLQHLASLYYVDKVILFDEETPIQLITAFLPDVLVKGGDYKAEDVVGYNEISKNGGSVEILPLLEGFSTSNFIKK